jgi:hypothetical protein
MDPDRRERKTIENFVAASLVFAARLALHLGIDQKGFIGSAATAFGIAAAQRRRRRSLDVDDFDGVG